MEELKQYDKRTNQDEIDLALILNKLGDLFSRIGANIRYTTQIIWRYKIYVSMFVVLGLGIGYVAHYQTKPYYSSSMTLILAKIRNEFIEDQLNKLSVMIMEDNFEEVSHRLDINIDAARQIKGMSFYNLDEERVAEDSVLTGSPFRIELMLYDNKLFDTMEPALTNYLENNRYFSKQKRIRQQQMLSLISKYKEDIQSLDSVKTTVANPEGPVNGFVYGQPIDPSNLYRESINMYQEQIELEAELEQMDNVEVVTGFVARLIPTGPNLIKYLLIGGLLGFLVGLIVALKLAAKKRKLMLK